MFHQFGDCTLNIFTVFYVPLLLNHTSGEKNHTSKASFSIVTLYAWYFSQDYGKPAHKSGDPFWCFFTLSPFILQYQKCLTTSYIFTNWAVFMKGNLLYERFLRSICDAPEYNCLRNAHIYIKKRKKSINSNVPVLRSENMSPLQNFKVIMIIKSCRAVISDGTLSFIRNIKMNINAVVEVCVVGCLCHYDFECSMYLWWENKAHEFWSFTRQCKIISFYI